MESYTGDHDHLTFSPLDVIDTSTFTFTVTPSTFTDGSGLHNEVSWGQFNGTVTGTVDGVTGSYTGDFSLYNPGTDPSYIFAPGH
jgi:hypothetical protein